MSMQTFWRTVLLLISGMAGIGLAHGAPMPDNGNASRYNSVLVISSYNPETYRVSPTIGGLVDTLAICAPNVTVSVESMNCKSYATAASWKGLMRSILQKHSAMLDSGIVVTLGMEAWMSYVAQDSALVADIPVICGMVSNNFINLPDDSADTSNEQTVFGFDDITKIKYKSGILYDYDVEKNINLILSLYPNTTNIAMLTDNSLGGVCMSAYTRDIISRKYPQLRYIPLDGRYSSALTITDRISKLPPNTILLLGTWRIDQNENYYLSNSIHLLIDETTLNVPVFTFSAMGLKYCCIGGYSPHYGNYGSILARKCANVLLGRVDIAEMSNYKTFVENEATFDCRLLDIYKIDKSRLPANSIFINEQMSLWAEHKMLFTIVIGVIVLLAFLIFVLTYFMFRFKILKDKLEKSESQLRISRDKAEEASRMKSAFLANMSHEIRTPLNAIVGFSGLICSPENTPEEKELFLSLINKNSQLLLGIINDVLDLSRLESGRMQFAYAPTDVVDLSRNMLLSVEGQAQSGVKMNFVCAESSREVETDPQKLGQVIVNLLTNACKFTREGHINLELSFDGNAMNFSVSDTGRGVPAEMTERIFMRFEKVDEFVQGTGLGLSLCRMIVEKFGGKIWLDSSYTQGARFCFRIPLSHRR